MHNSHPWADGLVSPPVPFLLPGIHHPSAPGGTWCSSRFKAATAPSPSSVKNGFRHGLPATS
jgi:hypothetical protein